MTECMTTDAYYYMSTSQFCNYMWMDWDVWCSCSKASICLEVENEVQMDNPFSPFVTL